ncbi:MAG: MptD family putative ECF transporter S component [Lachnospiraceae bacterium]|nr:MptD family putative ECF transporter S component [Lachnospiraceae bacterium]
MAKKEINRTTQADDKKMRTRDLIYAGAFGAVYIVLMLIVVLGTSAIPILYIVAPFTVGVVCATVYELCVLKVHKFGAALILGVLFALVACSGNILGMVLAIAAALAAELIIKAGNYKSRKMYLLSFLAFNLNMVCPYTMLYFHRDEFMARSVSFYGQEFADELAKYAVNGLAFIQIGLALAGAAIGVFIASKLIKKHFEKANII